MMKYVKCFLKIRVDYIDLDFIIEGLGHCLGKSQNDTDETRT